MNQEIKLAPITVFVGENDSGKSNILKAVNLFFNGEVVPGSKYDHGRDFSRIAPQRRKKAEEVTITAMLETPSQHQRHNIHWRKDWRRDGLHKVHGPKYEPTLQRYSKASLWLNRLNYRYIPANKGGAYMKDLMRELYGVLTTTVDAQIRGNAQGFVGDIREQTIQISDEIKDTLDLNSRIQLPADLSFLFELFDFETDGKILLAQRGDGIRARHIPIILNYLADRKNQAKKTVRGNTIWGYEEPENNIEMGAAFKQAEQLADYVERNHIQILITTHSPAFYGLGEHENVKVYLVQNEGGQEETIVKEVSNSNDIDVKMGIIPIVTPYIQNIAKELKDANELYKDSLPRNVPVLCVEGDFDKRIIDFCVEKMFPDKKGKFAVFAVQGVAKMPPTLSAVMGSSKTKHPVKCVGLFDDDNEGEKAQERCRALNIPSNKPTAKCKILTVNKPSIFRDVSVNSVFCLEHLLPCDYWEEARGQGFLKEHKEANIQIGEIARSSCLIGDIRLSYKVERKPDFAEFALEKMEVDGIPEDLKEQVETLIEKLEV